MSGIIPVSVVIVTKNEESRIGACLSALSDFSEKIVVDSQSSDATTRIARLHGASVTRFVWDGQYPKKRQWCLNSLPLKHNWVLFIDADEVMTPACAMKIAKATLRSDMRIAGYSIESRYVRDGKVLRHGLRNSKIALLDRRHMMFPPVDDLDLPGMGEIEGHYQPVIHPVLEGMKIGRISSPILHYAYDNAIAWEERHCRYAAWEAGMAAKDAWPRDPQPVRQAMKALFRSMPSRVRGTAAFLHSYVLKMGFLDGGAGFAHAWDRLRYYDMIAEASRARALAPIVPAAQMPVEAGQPLPHQPGETLDYDDEMIHHRRAQG